MILGLFILVTFGSDLSFPTGGLQGEALARAVAQQVNENGGTPIINGQTVHFLYKATNNEKPRIKGDFDNWRRGRNPDSTAMKHLAGNWYHFAIKALPESRIEYLLEIEGKDQADPRNPLMGESWSGKISLVQMPDFPKQPELETRNDIPHGRVVDFTFKSALRRNERKVFVYTPPEYNENRFYPTLYIGDGTYYVEMGDMPNILDNLIAEKTIPPVIAVFIDPVDRWLEYRMFTLFRGMMLEELMPHLQEKWGIDTSQQILIGGSRGGMAAIDLALTHPKTFSGVLAFAPAVTETDFMAVLKRMKPDTHTQYRILVGNYDFWHPTAKEIGQVMKAKGYDISYKEKPVGHSIHAWRMFLDEELPPLLN